MKRQLDRRRQQHWCHLQSCCRTFYRANADDALQSRNVRHRQELKPQTTTYFARVTYGPWEGVLGKLLRDSSSSLLLAYRLGLLLKEASCPRVTGPKARLPESQRNKHYARGAPRLTGMMAPLVDPERFPGVIWEHVGRNPDLGLGEDRCLQVTLHLAAMRSRARGYALDCVHLVCRSSQGLQFSLPPHARCRRARFHGKDIETWTEWNPDRNPVMKF